MLLWDRRRIGSFYIDMGENEPFCHLLLDIYNRQTYQKRHQHKRINNIFIANKITSYDMHHFYIGLNYRILNHLFDLLSA